jgi:hypothetical protein
MRTLLIIIQMLLAQGTYAAITASNHCENLKGDCDFYACVEEEYQCGRRGYPTGFGQKYCLRFGINENWFSDKGKEWIQKTRTCLTERILNAPDFNDCRQLRLQAFADHIPCYVDSGFCELSFRDKFKVFRLVKRTFLRPSMIATALKTLRRCRYSTKL